MLKSSSIWCAFSLLVALLAAFILTFPNPELDWDDTHLPNAQRYMQELELTTTSTTTTTKEYPLRGLVIAITGSTSGIGLELTRTLSNLGATVLAIGRSSTKLERLFGDNPNVEPVLADLNDLASVSTASQHILQRYHQLDVLVNNAGIHTGFSGMWTRTTTKQGYEPTFGVNYLSHFLLTEQLLPLMIRTSKKPKVVQISSSFHRAVDGSDLGTVVVGGGGGGDTAQTSPPIASVPGGSHGFLLFKSQRQYANSKLAQIYHARSLQKRYHTAGVTAVSICPAWVGTQIGSKEGTWMHTLFKMAVFPADGYGLSSILHAIFDDYDHSKNQDDFYVNANIPGIERMETFLEPSWMYSLVPIRDLWGSLFAGFLLIAERFFPFYGTVKSSHPSYNERHQNELYEWSRDAVSEWL